ncbi:MAG: hypothetical protein JJT94_04225 [Bernardetiaceae bacterium]|nr:hypothetical protein [Bernardetiaceae bacterium]
MALNLPIQTIEAELKKRWAYPYRWGRKQQDDWDSITNFIYKTHTFEALFEALAQQKSRADYRDIVDYAMNRWYNFHSAKAVEHIFASSPKVQPEHDRYHRLVDFHIEGLNFDHKTTVFPRGLQKPITWAKEHPKALIQWLYENQSQQQRKHLHNRLFIVVYHNAGAHWKLKAELTLIQTAVTAYLSNFDKNKLHSFDFEAGHKTFSDIIWVIG